MFKRLFDDGLKELKGDLKRAQKVLDLEPTIEKLSDEELKAKTPYFKELLAKGSTLDDILVEAYAVVREAAWRVTAKKPFKVQVAGAIAIHGGNIAEMKTGEGKTLTAVMPAYLNALGGNGVHIVTVNEYLASREVEGEIGQLFRWLGLTVGLNVAAYTKAQKQQEYKKDILYSTNSELGFDYLRDHMVMNKNELVQTRGLNFAIIDEVDSILIDEARTPLIISGNPKSEKDMYAGADSFVKRLKDPDYEIDLEHKTIDLTDSGVQKAKQKFGRGNPNFNLYDVSNVKLVHHINNALKANYVFTLGKEYVVQDNEVKIVDGFTGRILEGRRYNEGLHQAIEAKEGVSIKDETVTVATITYQNFFRMYKKLSGMTGTAKTEEEEFINIYNMYVVEVPTNKPVIRIDQPDLMFYDRERKFKALVKEVVRRHELGQPMLIGTVAIETSEYISQKLREAGVPHEVLNAKNNRREAEIIEHAGEIGAVTIATNMAGRGTDIKLAPGVVERGGLCVFGTERHEARRIDNQLRGRSGRQGDPGFSQFYTSADDDLMLRFGNDRFKSTMQRLVKMGNKDLDQPLQYKVITSAVTQAQTRIEGFNFDSRKNVLKYDDVIRVQRELFYKQRNDILLEDNIDKITWNMIHKFIENETDQHMKEVRKNRFEIDDDAIATIFNRSYFGRNSVDVNVIKTLDEDAITEYLYSVGRKKTLAKFSLTDEDLTYLDSDIDVESLNAEEKVSYDYKQGLYKAYKYFIKYYTLRIVDYYWTEHIDRMSELRQGIGLQSYGQINPVQAYQKKGKEYFDELTKTINKIVTINVINAPVDNLLAQVPKSQGDSTKNLVANDGKGMKAKAKPIVNEAKRAAKAERAKRQAEHKAQLKKEREAKNPSLSQTK